MSLPASSHKCVLLGDSGVGKTSLITRWAFSRFEANPTMTVGAVNIHRKLMVDGNECEIHVWDTAGQERFAGLANLYSRGAKCAIIVLAADRPVDWDDAMYRWGEVLKSANVRSRILAITKIDIENSVTYQSVRDRFERDVDEIFLVSALTGENVTELFREATRRVNVELTGDEFTQVSIRELNDNESGNCC